ncbi:alpha/beta hydrolase [Microbacterium aquimaris]|uniref:Alpha/beta hydrolase family protein n=1 Tax=Microbacterium aquimaris TaxID=459816 RepID=A0ABU5N3C5_9MICO|nr:hypothetical protein [Microbacterium aquimaris]MDZ8160584.1 hypothetical protein [Microbacterium aquimaris]
MRTHPERAARGIVLFAPGAGGDPARYADTIDRIVAAGYIVSAATHERFDARHATAEQMCERAVGLADALEGIDRPELPVVAIGHSAGGWAALCLAGARPRGREGGLLDVPVVRRVRKAIALAPPMGWFAAPDAWATVHAEIEILSGAADGVTPPETAQIARRSPRPVNLRTYPGVGHLDVMTVLPPGVSVTPGLDHAAFLDKLASDMVDALP